MKLLYTLFLSLIFCCHSVQSQNNYNAIFNKCKKSVFKITTFNENNVELAIGSGFFIDSNGVALTNFHVLADAFSAEIMLANGKIYQLKNILGADKQMDLVKFSISKTKDSEKFPCLKVSTSIPKIGDKSFVIGNPIGLEFSFSDGIISGFRKDNGIDLIQTTAPISSGNSGSPLLNSKGNVLGIISFTFKVGQNLNFAISTENLTELNSKATEILMQNVNLTNLYKNVGEHYKFYSLKAFAESLQNEKKCRNFYNTLTINYEMPSYEDFVSDMGLNELYTLPLDNNIAEEPKSTKPNNSETKEVLNPPSVGHKVIESNLPFFLEYTQLTSNGQYTVLINKNGRDQMILSTIDGHTQKGWFYTNIMIALNDNLTYLITIGWTSEMMNEHKVLFIFSDCQNEATRRIFESEITLEKAPDSGNRSIWGAKLSVEDYNPISFIIKEKLLISDIFISKDSFRLPIYEYKNN